MLAVIKYAWSGMEGNYLRWTTLCAYSLHCCRCAYVVQSADNGVPFSGLDSRTISLVPFMDSVWLCLHLHTVIKLYENGKCGSHRRNMRSTKMHNACWNVLCILNVKLLVKRYNSHLSRCVH